MGQVSRISRNNTRIYCDGDNAEVWLHKTCIVTVRPDKIVLNTGGWYSKTTQRRMLQVSHEWELGYGVSFSKRHGYVVRYYGQEYPFDANHRCVLPRKKEGVSHERP